MEPTVRYACFCRIVGIFGGYVAMTPCALGCWNSNWIFQGLEIDRILTCEWAPDRKDAHLCLLDEKRSRLQLNDNK